MFVYLHVYINAYIYIYIYIYCGDLVKFRALVVGCRVRLGIGPSGFGPSSSPCERESVWNVPWGRVQF